MAGSQHLAATAAGRAPLGMHVMRMLHMMLMHLMRMDGWATGAPAPCPRMSCWRY